MSLRFSASTAATGPAPRAARLRMLGLAAAGSLVLAISAHIAVPFWPVPMTLQTLAVLLFGALMGPLTAAAATLAYVLEGAAGLPVFSHGATPFGPTMGYIVGFVPGALVAGWGVRRARGLPGLVGTFLAADAVIFAFGVAWLSTLVGVEKAIAVGVAPFLLGEALKIALATAASYPALRRR